MFFLLGFYPIYRAETIDYDGMKNIKNAFKTVFLIIRQLLSLYINLANT